jgi:hypothetical protein
MSLKGYEAINRSTLKVEDETQLRIYSDPNDVKRATYDIIPPKRLNEFSCKILFTNSEFCLSEKGMPNLSYIT